jgi:hypothetical protein
MQMMLDDIANHPDNSERCADWRLASYAEKDNSVRKFRQTFATTTLAAREWLCAQFPAWSFGRRKQEDCTNLGQDSFREIFPLASVVFSDNALHAVSLPINLTVLLQLLMVTKPT